MKTETDTASVPPASGKGHEGLLSRAFRESAQLPPSFLSSESVFSGFPATNCVTMCSNGLLSAACLLALIPKTKDQHRVTTTMHWLVLHFSSCSCGNPEAGWVWGRIFGVQNLASHVLTPQPCSPTLHGDDMQVIFMFSTFHMARALHTVYHLIFTVILNG